VRARRRPQGHIDTLRSNRHARTDAQLTTLIDKHLETAELEQTTRDGYQANLRKHIRPLLGRLKTTALNVEILESLTPRCAAAATTATATAPSSNTGVSCLSARWHRCVAWAVRMTSIYSSRV